MVAFLITIDTEGDDLWSHPSEITVENAKFLPRFQALAEGFGFKPTWLTNFEMATSPAFVTFGRAATDRGAAEIGMHLHAWNSPPLVALTADDYRHQPYLVEYPEELMAQKIEYMTALLQDAFRSPVVSHRAGRWAFDSRYARLLVANGYKVDCSVTPGIDWSSSPGSPEGAGGTNYKNYLTGPYFMAIDDVRSPGDSSLLELPMTIVDARPELLRKLDSRCKYSTSPIARKIWPLHWMRPNGRNLDAMFQIVHRAIIEKWPYLEFMIHSSELMPGGSPYFRTAESIEKLYSDIQKLFSRVAESCVGMTLAEFHQNFSIETKSAKPTG